MSTRKVPLNPAQAELLDWVQKGCPEGVYSGWSHRVTARALHNRGLLIVKGHGQAWTAALTADGLYYLENGTYPPATDAVADADARTPVPAPKQREPAQTATKPSKPRKRATAPSKQAVQVDQMIAALHEADGHRIVVPGSEETRYRKLVAAATRLDRIPDGMRITLTERHDWQCTVTLEPLPAPIDVPKQLRDPSDVAVAFSTSETFQVSGDSRKRALRMADALVKAARSRGMKVKAVVNQPVDRDYRRRDARRDGIEFSLEHDRFWVWFAQRALHVPHEPTRREINRVQHGYLFPDYDDVPDPQLGLDLEGEHEVGGGERWSRSWRDTDEHQLEDDLSEILEALQLRHEYLTEKRIAEREKYIALNLQREQDEARAVVKYQKQFLIDTMNQHAQRWEDTARLRRYAEAVRAEAERLDGPERERALAWADQIDAHAKDTDPLPGAAAPPVIPTPSSSDLSPFMNARSPYGW